MANDISQLDTTLLANEGAVMQLMHPTLPEPLTNDDGSPMTITLLGIDSEKYKKAEQAALNRRLAMGGRRGVGKTTAQELDSAAIVSLIAATVDWRITLGGNMPECNETNVRVAYTKYAWLREQVDQFVNDRSNFLKAASTPNTSQA